MENKQTAVEWLIEQWPILESQLPPWLINQAKAMEKEQIIETYNEGALDGLQLGEQYYNFVYGKSNS